MPAGDLYLADGKPIFRDGRLSLCGCCDCGTYFRVTQCGANGSCPGIPAVAYVCASSLCSDLTPIGPPNNLVIRTGGGCFSVNMTPIPAAELPTGATIIPPGFLCTPNCDGCNLPQGHFRAVPCTCNPSGTSIVSIACPCYWAALKAGIQCPVFRSNDGRCYEVGGFQNSPPGGEILCDAVDGCCQCCAACSDALHQVGTFGCFEGFFGINGPIKACCCGLVNEFGEPVGGFQVTGEGESSLFGDGGDGFCTLVRTVWTISTTSRQIIVREDRYTRPFCSAPLVLSDSTSSVILPVCNPFLYAPGGGFSGSRGPVTTSCSVPTQFLVTGSGSLTCTSWKGEQAVTYADGHIDKSRWSIVIRPGGGCRGNCEQANGARPPSQQLRIATGAETLAVLAGGGAAAGSDTCGGCADGIGF